MGTRGLTAVILDGEFKVAQYGQWDHYPTGQGQIINDFITHKMNTEVFKQALRECEWVSNEELQQNWVKCGAKLNEEFVTIDISQKFATNYPELSRDTGGDILELIQNKNVRKLKNSVDFAQDSLFCEWAYILDMDNEVLEVYRGFNKTPIHESERFAHLGKEGEYYPIRLLIAIPFSKLKDNTMNRISQGEDIINEMIEELDSQV